MSNLVIPRITVESTCIRSVGYSEPAHVLEIEFTSGAVYRYLGVLPEVHGALMTAASKGAYLNRTIKGRYPEARPDGLGEVGHRF